MPALAPVHSAAMWTGILIFREMLESDFFAVVSAFEVEEGGKKAAMIFAPVSLEVI